MYIHIEFILLELLMYTRLDGATENENVENEEEEDVKPKFKSIFKFIKESARLSADEKSRGGLDIIGTITAFIFFQTSFTSLIPATT